MTELEQTIAQAQTIPQRNRAIRLEATRVKAEAAKLELEQASKRLLIAKESLQEKRRRIKRPPLKYALLRQGEELQKKTRMEQARTAVRMVQEWEKTIEEEYNSTEKDRLQEEIRLFLSSLTKRY